MGIACEHIILDDDMNREQFEEYLYEILYKYSTRFPKLGMILQLPSPQEYVDIFNEIIPPITDVDGFGETNTALLSMGKTPYHYSATPKGIITLLDNYNIPIEGKNVVIIGRSNIVGKPLANMLLNRDATITICHSKTKNLEQITCQADILIVAVGKSKFIKSHHIKQNAVVIDVGINRTEEGLCGDVDFDAVKDKCSAITPVPGGVGLMTVYSLIENVANI
jgi:methylenetetrahydrofolate dehydrogenase (NADP+)/methenyltetrahydrofolate cyclohydrolase